MLFSGEWTKQLVTGFVTGAILICATIGHAEDLGIVFTQASAPGPEMQPSWWNDRDVLDPRKTPANNSAVNAGQLKWATRQLHEELSTLLPPQADLFALEEINAAAPDAYDEVLPSDPAFQDWKAKNHAAVTLGQLKNSAVKLYDALYEISPSWLSDQMTRSGHPSDGRKYPWTETSSDDKNKAPANIGQLKAVFSLRLRESLDDDLLPDLFELALIKYVPAFAGKTINDITWNPGDAYVSLKTTGGATTVPTDTLIPNIGGSRTGVLSASALLAEHEPVGSVGGSFSVGGDGAANYSIPINIPKGTSGVEPQIALSYSSGAGNGSLGIGFDISGFQRITRGPTSRMKDGFVDPVDFDDNDRFYFDGELLIATSGDYGKNGTQYQTESNSFARIISHGQLNSGPQYWTVETKAGLTIELGNCSTSCVASVDGKGALIWNVNRVSDNVGNYYKVEYQLDVGGGPLDYRLARVKYTGNESTLAPYNEIRFNWEDRQDAAEQFIHGIKIRNSKRLSTIDVYSGSRKLFYYETVYQYGAANGASHLMSITKCIDGDNKLPATNFHWMKEPAPMTASWDEDPINKNNSYLYRRLNGKLMEIISPNHNYFQWMATDGDYAGSQINGFIDLNGDGLPDRVSQYDYGVASTLENINNYGLWVAINTGNGFKRATRWWGSSQPEDNYFTWFLGGSQVNGFIDLNGDGRPDRVAHHNYETNENGIWVSLNTGGGFAPATKWKSSPQPEDSYFQWNYNGSQVNGFIDLNGDGLPDRVSHYNYTTNENGLWVSLNTGSGFAEAEKWWSSPQLEDNFFQWHSGTSQLNGFMDLNGDGLVDRVAHYNFATNKYGLWVSLNTGSGFAPATEWWSSPQAEDNFLEWDISGSKLNGFADLNGDGLPDRVAYRNDAGEYGLWVSLNDGTKFVKQTHSWWSSPQGEDNYIVWDFNGSKVNGLVDLNGDGLLDRVSHRKFTATNTGEYGLWVSLNTGAGFATATKWWSSAQIEDNFPEWDISGSKINGFADLNGDGLLDRLAHRNYITGEYGLWVSLNTRSGFAAATKWYTSTQGSEDYYPAWNVAGGGQVNGFIDLNGDGLLDRLQNEFFDRSKVHFNTGSGFDSDQYPQDLGSRITSITDGLGAEIKIEYKRGSIETPDAAGRKIYTKAIFNETESAAGVTGVNGAGYLVSRYAEQNGLGGYRWTRQYYGERKVDRNHEEDLGFKWIESVDEQRGNGSITTYSQQYPYQTLPLETISYLRSGGSKILTSKETYSYGKHADIPGTGGKVHFIYQAGTTRENYAFEGPHTAISTLAGASPLAPVFVGNLLSSATTTNGGFDTWGNLLSSSATSSDGFGTTNSNVYEPAITTSGKWILGRLQSSTVTKTGPSGYAPVTKTSTFTYYTDGPFKGMLETEIAEPSEALAVRKTYGYDAWGNRSLTTITALNSDQPPRRSWVTYDPTGRFPLEEKNELGHTVTYQYDQTRSLLLSATGANGLTTRYFYDAWGTKILTRNADGTETAEITRYATNGDVPAGTGLDPVEQKIVFIRKTQGTGAAATTAYIDAQGRVLMSSAESFDGRLVFSRTDFDVHGRQFRKSLPFFAGDTIRWSSVEFDDADRTFKTTSPDGSEASVVYDGFQSVMTNPLGQHQTRVENAQGWLVSTADNDGNVTTFDYTVDGKPKKTTAPGDHVIETDLDAFGQKKSMTDSDVGHSTTDYYAFGEVKKTTDGKNATAEFTYDSLGRQKTRIVRDGAGILDSTTTWTYDTAPGAGKGKIHTVEMKNGVGNITYLSSVRYDALGRVAETTVSHHGETFKSSATYDSIGRVQRETDAGGLTVLHEYNARGFETGIRDHLTGELYWKPVEYDAAGRLVREELGNGVVNTNSFDQNRGTLTASQSKKGGDFLQNMAYEWDETGNFKKRSDLRASLSEEFHYDSLNRLDWSQVNGKARLNYGYTDSGNIESKANVGTYSYEQTGGAGPHAVTGITGNGVSRSFEYDTNGALTIEKRNGQQYREVVWTVHADVKSFTLFSGPRVLKIDGSELFAAGKTVTSFEYDASFERSQKITERDQLSREVTLYLGSYERIVTASRVNTNLGYTDQKVEHRHSIGGLALKTFTEEAGVTSEATAYYLKDHLGSLTALLDENGIVKERYSFDAWGARRDAATWSDSSYEKFTKIMSTNRGFTGHEMLDEIGLVHMNGRIYDPEIGRVLSGDPIIQDPADTQNYNRYSYVINNPLSLTDPSGFSFFGKIFKFHKKMLYGNIRDLDKKLRNKATKWLAENQWAGIVVTIVVGIVTMGVGVGIAAATYGATAATLSIGAGITSALGAIAAGTIGGMVAGLGFIGGVMAGAIGGFLAGGVNAALAGGDFGDVLKGAVVGGLQGAASAGIGHGSFFSAGGAFGRAYQAAQTVAHGILGGTVNAVMGGKFADGFLSAAAAKAASYLPGVSEYLDPKSTQGKGITIFGRTALAAVIGGTASAVGGGKFASGAKTAAFQHLFNAEFRSAPKRLLLVSNDPDNPMPERAIKYWQNEGFFDTTTVMVNDDVEFANALVSNGDYNQLVYLGHGVPGALAVSWRVGGNIFSDSSGVWVGTKVSDLNRSYFKPASGSSISIMLISCNSAVSDRAYGSSVSQAFAQHFGVPVLGAGAGVGFSANGEPHIRNWRSTFAWLSNASSGISNGGGWQVSIPTYGR